MYVISANAAKFPDYWTSWYFHTEIDYKHLIWQFMWRGFFFSLFFTGGQGSSTQNPEGREGRDRSRGVQTFGS